MNTSARRANQALPGADPSPQRRIPPSLAFRLTAGSTLITFFKNRNMKASGPAARVSASLPSKLLRDFDAMAQRKGYRNRSLALAGLMREQLVEELQERDTKEIAGVITLVFDHHKRNLQGSLTSLAHDHSKLIIATLHVHLDHDNCLEVIVARGQAWSLKKLADALITAKGVKHGRLTVTTTGGDLPP
jgi:CopG family transcriptional regulator, nickel-responsive regulator